MIGTVVRSRLAAPPPTVACADLSCFGVQLSIVSVSLMALNSLADVNVTTALGVLQAIIPALFMNVCIVGFNQLCDVEIDKVKCVHSGRSA